MDEWLNRMGCIHAPECHSALKRKEILTPATTRMNLEDIVLCDTKPDTKGHMLYDSTPLSYLEWANHRQKVE